MYFAWKGRVSSGDALLDRDLRDTEIVQIGSESYLFAANGSNGGLTSYRLSDSGDTQVVDRAYFFGALNLGGLAAAVEVDGALRVVVGGGTAAPLLGYAIGGNGQINTLQHSADLSKGTAQISGIASARIGGTDAMYMVDSGTGQLTTYVAGTNGQFEAQTQEGQRHAVSGHSDLETVRIGSSDFLIASDSVANRVVTYRIDASNAGLAKVDEMGAAEGLGVQTPSAMEVVTAFGQTFVVLAAAGSNSLSVMTVASNGALRATDHVIDTLATRFGNVQSVAAVEKDGRVFIVAGGGDDGLSLFTLTPDGRLIHLQSIAHTTGVGLQDVRHIEAHVLGNSMQVFVGSEEAGGLSQFNVDLSRVGDILRDTQSGGQQLVGGTADDMLVAGLNGHDTLLGGNGNDILIAADAHVTMRGGGGADRFVMAETEYTQRIEDFEAGIDRLDLSGLQFLRGTHQITLQATANGARVSFWKTEIEITSSNFRPLSMEDLFGTGFDHPDRILTLADDTGLDLTGDQSANNLIGSGFDDTLTGKGGADMLDGGDKNDLLAGGGGRDTLHGGLGDDTLRDYFGADVLDGGDGNDLMSAGVGNDRLIGGRGADTIYGGDGDDFVDAGRSNDTVYGGKGADKILGDDGNDSLSAGDGADTIKAGNGSDTVFGGAGNDRIFTGAHGDMASGGSGRDIMKGFQGDDTLSGDKGADVIRGQAGNDLLRGGAENDELRGGVGNDTIDGDADNDSIWGGEGNDVLRGGSGNDVLIGFDDNDHLFGETGDDQMWGGAGNDLFHVGVMAGNDRIMDFEIGADRIRIYKNGIDFSDLKLNQTGNDVVLSLGPSRITIENLSLEDLSAQDFLFS